MVMSATGINRVITTKPADSTMTTISTLKSSAALAVVAPLSKNASTLMMVPQT